MRLKNWKVCKTCWKGEQEREMKSKKEMAQAALIAIIFDFYFNLFGCLILL